MVLSTVLLLASCILVTANTPVCDGRETDAKEAAEDEDLSFLLQSRMPGASLAGEASSQLMLPVSVAKVPMPARLPAVDGAGNSARAAAGDASPSAAGLELASQEELLGGELFTFRWEGDRMVRAWMPPGHDQGKEALPSLWLNDGQNLFHDEMVAFGGVSWGAAGTALHLMESGCIPRLAVIGVDNAGARRSYDYLPAPPGDWGGLRNGTAEAPGGGVAAYSERVLKELLPWAEKRFGLSAKAEDRVFGGSSFGGISALYMAMLHPEAFHGVLIESPSFWACDGRLMADVAGHAGKPWPKRVYLAMGSREYTASRPNTGEAGPKADDFLAAALAECAGLMGEQGVSAERLDWHVDPGAAHNERDWRRRLPRALRWLFGERAPVAAKALGAVVWTRPSPVRPGRPFELYVDPERVKLPKGGALRWSAKILDTPLLPFGRVIQDAPLLPAGLPRAQAAGVQWLAALASAPEGTRDLRFSLTDGQSFDNNGGQDYGLQVAH